MNYQPTRTKKPGVALNITMWLAIAWFAAGVVSTVVGPTSAPPSPQQFTFVGAPLRQVQPKPKPVVPEPPPDTTPEFHDPGWTAEDEAIATVTGRDLRIAIRKAGSGQPFVLSDGGVVEYTAWLEDGTVFDSTLDPEFGHPGPFEFANLTHVSEGWEEGLIGMQVGETRKLWIPYVLNYSLDGQPPAELRGEALIFEIELLKIKKPGE